MYVRLHRQRHGGREYTSVHICESFRDPARGGTPRNRVLVNLGPLEKIGADAVRNLAAGFGKIAGERPEGSVVRLSEAKDFGHVYALDELWKKLRFSEALTQAGISGDTTFPVADLVKLMVINRACDPVSKLALLEWLEGVHLPEFEHRKPSYHHLLRAMDRLIAVKEKAEPLVAEHLLSDSGMPVDLVFYDITSTYFEGDRSISEEDLRRYGYSRDHRFDRRQVTIGLVMTRDGIPLCHHVFPGNTLDKTTVAEVVRDLKSRFHLSQVIFVGDRGMLSDGNLETILDEELGFIVAHPLRRNRMAAEVIEELGRKFDRTKEEEQFLEDRRNFLRFVLAYSPVIAQDVREERMRRFSEADGFIGEMLHKLTDPSPSRRGRKMTPQGAYDRIRDYLRDRHLLSFYEVAITDDQVTVVPHDASRAWEEKIDGMLLVETTDLTSLPKEVNRRYKELAEIERGWRALKSSLLLRPVRHWTERRIRAHVFLCVLALQIERWMRKSLRSVSAQKAVDVLRRIKAVTVTSPGGSSRVTTVVTAEQKDLLKQLGVPPLSGVLPESCSV
jgi:transposase